MRVNGSETELFVPLLYNEEDGTFIYLIHNVFKRLHQNGREDIIYHSMTSLGILNVVKEIWRELHLVKSDAMTNAIRHQIS